MRSRKRVALIVPDMRGGGAERVALTLAEDLSANGCEVDLVLVRSGGELLALVPDEVNVIELNVPRFRNALGQLRRYFRERKPDSTQAFMWPVSVLAILAHRLAGKPGRLVVSDHTMPSRHYAGKGSLNDLALRQTLRRLYPLADARVIVSEDSRADIARLSGLPAEDFTVIYNPIRRPSDSFPEQFWSEPGSRILTIGSLKPEKNHRLLLDAFALVAKNRDVQLAIVGDGTCREELHKRAAELGIADRVQMPGFVLEPSGWYASADLFVLSSDYEGYPLVLVEALASSLNVVSTDCSSGPREILDGGRFGRLVPVGDAAALARGIEEALANPFAPDELKQRATELSGDSLAAYRRIMLGGAAPQGAAASR